jgi:hypothetical protein
VHIKGWKDTKIPKQIPVPQIPVQTQNQPHYDALREYLREQHNIKVSSDEITKGQFPWLAFSKTGAPLLYGDPALHEELKLPDAYRVVRSQSGVLHKAYDPEKVQPKIFKVHATSFVNY